MTSVKCSPDDGVTYLPQKQYRLTISSYSAIFYRGSDPIFSPLSKGMADQSQFTRHALPVLMHFDVLKEKMASLLRLQVAAESQTLRHATLRGNRDALSRRLPIELTFCPFGGITPTSNESRLWVLPPVMHGLQIVFAAR